MNAGRGCPRGNMSRGEYVQVGIYPGRGCPQGNMSRGEYVQVGICPSGNISRGICVLVECIQGEIVAGGGHLAGTPYRYCKSHGDMRELKCCCCKSHVHTVMEH